MIKALKKILVKILFFNEILLLDISSFLLAIVTQDSSRELCPQKNFDNGHTFYD